MSRKWERMVKKNTKVVNVQRKKDGKESIAAGASDGSIVFKGRSWLLPIFLAATGIFSFIVFRQEAGQESMYWVTGSSYLLLAAFIYWVRRPFLKVARTELSSRRFGGDRTIAGEDIQDIEFAKDAVVVTLKQKKQRWVFSKFAHRFPLDQLKAAVQEFAQRNNVELKQES